jgi:aspartate racemase
MHLGLIGGIGPAATDYYYQGLIRAMASRELPLELTIAHADAGTLVRNMQCGDGAAQADIFYGLSKRLALAGADRIAVTSIAGHFCIEELQHRAVLPISNMILEVQREISRRGLKKIGLIGTSTVMETEFYGSLGSVAVHVPGAESFARVHQNYVDMALSGQVTPEQRELFFQVGRDLCDQQGVQAVVLGGTDLFLAFDGQTCDFPVIDCAALHIEALAEVAAT